MNNETSAGVASGTDQRAGQYLTFVLAGEIYGLGILQVREIIGTTDITAVPRTPTFVKGVINLRGRVVPVIDARLKFGMPETEPTDRTCIIVVDVGETDVGLIVDEVSEVVHIPADQIEDAPSFGADVDTRFILGMSKADEEVTILLDLTKVLAGPELAAMAGVASDATSQNEGNE
ncbi:hypothetical protein LCGC14_1585050 [marine sediment metagenome]|uniref:CheW-like domain-containing protein n=1 Tax=marine sediment metagenome TaxID=412755 RepID=A0A0F9IFQ0_9ZZZZ